MKYSDHLKQCRGFKVQSKLSKRCKLLEVALHHVLKRRRRLLLIVILAFLPTRDFAGCVGPTRMNLQFQLPPPRSTKIEFGDTFPGVIVNEEYERVVMEPRYIARHYLHGWFLLDLVSSIPADYTLDGITTLVSSQPLRRRDDSLARNVRLLQITKFLKLLRLLRLARLVRYLNLAQENYVSIVCHAHY